MTDIITAFSIKVKLALRHSIRAVYKYNLMRGRPLGQFPHYWALIPVTPDKKFRNMFAIKLQAGNSITH